MNAATTITATFQVNTTGTLSVTTTPVSGSITVDGAFKANGSWSGSVTAGSHTISFGAVSGYNTPANQTVTVNSGATMTVTGTYTPSPGTLSVTTTPVSGGITVDGAFKANGSWSGSVTAGSHTISFGAVSGYNTPANQTITVSSGQTISMTATYVAQPVAGICGSSDGQTLAIAPVTNLCSVGTATAVSGIGPWTWTCTGSNGGVTTSCSVNKTVISHTTFATGTYGNNANLNDTLSIANATSLTVTVIGNTEAGYDFIKIYDSSNVLQRSYSGAGINQTFTVSGSSIKVVFTSDSSVTASGVTVTIASGPVLHTTFATGTYGNNANLNDILSIAGATSLTVTVIGDTEAGYDFIKIYDSSNVLQRLYSGAGINQTFTVSGSSINVVFTSDSSVTASGVTVTIASRP